MFGIIKRLEEIFLFIISARYYDIIYGFNNYQAEVYILPKG